MFPKGWRLSRGLARFRSAGPLNAFRRTILRGILTTAAVLAAASCGLPTIPFLAGPVNPDAEGVNVENRILTFDHNTENAGDDFQGYELYYKLYDVGNITDIDADSNYISSGDGEPGPGRLEQRGFVRAVAVTERGFDDPYPVNDILQGDDLPHLPTDPTTSSVEYRIDLSDPLNADPDSDVIVTWSAAGGRARGFRRRSRRTDFGSDPTVTLDSFWDASGYDAADYDIVEMGLEDAVAGDDSGDGTPDRFEIVFYALAYGIDGTTFTGYYSVPLRLEEAEIVLAQ